MLSEAEITELIARGENEEVDFKQALNLDSSSEKAELIKDVISIANSKVNVGFLLIGVNNNTNLVGVNSVQEERIQQIIHTYINPSPIISCYLTSLNDNSLNVGVIEIKGFEKPYKVLRSIDKLLQNEVFVRHGSVVAKASPEEIYRMFEESRVFFQRFRYIKSAENFLKLNNLEGAINSYSKAIELMPTSDTLLSRAKVYLDISREAEKPIDIKLRNKGLIELLQEVKNPVDKQKIAQEIEDKWKRVAEQRNLALKDISDAVVLANSFDLEKQARFDRTKILCATSNTYLTNIWDEDLNWLKKHTQGEELAKVLLLEVERIEGDDPLCYKPNEYALSLLDEIISIGYSHIDVYVKRVDAHFGLFNYGLVLEDVEKALTLTDDSDKILHLLCMKAWALTRMYKFDEAFALGEELERRYRKEEFNGFFVSIYGIEDEILCKCAMSLEYGNPSSEEKQKILEIVHFFQGAMRSFEKEHPKLSSILKQFLNDTTTT